MTDNLPAPAPTGFALDDHGLVHLQGPDASAFAHTQFSSDVAALAVGHWQWSAWLTPKGRVIALFALLKPAADHIVLVLPDYPAQPLAQALRRYVFRRKLGIAAGETSAVSGTFATPARASGSVIDVQADAMEIDYGGTGGPRSLRIGAAATADVAQRDQWRRHDLRHGLPRLPDSQREHWTPQQLSLDRLAAYSVKKGCYPGQEIVARTHFLGKAKRALALFESAAMPAPGDKVGDGTHELGEVVSVQDGSPALALAVLPLERAPADLRAGAVALREVPLLEGLAR